MHSMEPNSPVDTPATPSKPNLPPLPNLITSLTFAPGSKHAVSSPISPASAANLALRRRNSSVPSIPTSPLQTTLQRALPIRPAKMAKISEQAPLYNLRKVHTITSPGTSTSTHSTHIKIKGRSKSRRPRSPPPRYHVTVLSNCHRRKRPTHQAPSLTSAISHLATPLVPLISVTSGQPHPHFPTSILQYKLLTHSQLDSLARFYHQTTPAVSATWRYPAAIEPWVSSDDAAKDDDEIVGGNVGLETKRRRWGRFIGLRGCESPVAADEEAALLERMEREWRRSLERREEEERLSEKGWRGRW